VSVEEFYKKFYFRPSKIAEIVGEMLTSRHMLVRRLREEGVEFLPVPQGTGKTHDRFLTLETLERFVHGDRFRRPPARSQPGGGSARTRMACSTAAKPDGVGRGCRRLRWRGPRNLPKLRVGPIFFNFWFLVDVMEKRRLFARRRIVPDLVAPR